MKKFFWNSYSVTKQLGLLSIYLIFTFYIVTATITTPALSAKLLYALGGGVILVGALYYEYLKFLYTKMTTALTMQTDLAQCKKAREKLVKYDIFNGFKGSLIIFDSLCLMDEGNYQGCLEHMNQHHDFFHGSPDYLFIFWYNQLLCYYFLKEPTKMLYCGDKLREFKHSDQKHFSPLFSFDEIDALIASANGLHQKSIRHLDKISPKRLNAREKAYYYHILANEYRILNDSKQVGHYLKLARKYQNTMHFRG